MKKILFMTAVFLATIFICSCATTTSLPAEKEGGVKVEKREEAKEKGSKKESEKKSEVKTEIKRTPVTSIPQLTFAGSTMKIELENMYTEDIAFKHSDEYSSSFAAVIKSGVSCAKASVTLSAGSYEILAKEKAEDSEHASFYIFVDNEPYRVSPSEPPLGTFEMTTRFPVTFSVDKAKTVLITVQANSPHHPGQTGMMLDYLQLRKLN